EHFHDAAEGVQLGWRAASAQALWRGRVEVQRRPGHLVAREVQLDAKLGQNRVADDAVQFRARQAEAVHALKLKPVLDAGLELGQRHAAFDVEAVERAPALAVRLDAKLGADGRGHEQRGRARIDNEVVRSLAVDLGADHHVLRVRDRVGNSKRLGLDLLVLAGPYGRDEADDGEAAANPRPLHANLRKQIDGSDSRRLRPLLAQL